MDKRYNRECKNKTVPNSIKMQNESLLEIEYKYKDEGSLNSTAL